jgi:hypothetical protein
MNGICFSGAVPGNFGKQFDSSNGKPFSAKAIRTLRAYGLG